MVTNGWIRHGPRRRWYAPWQVVGCRCGVDAHPCPAVRMRAAQALRIQASNPAPANRWQR
jgi:hypothetical protein